MCGPKPGRGRLRAGNSGAVERRLSKKEPLSSAAKGRLSLPQRRRNLCGSGEYRDVLSCSHDIIRHGSGTGSQRALGEDQMQISHCSTLRMKSLGTAVAGALIAYIGSNSHVVAQPAPREVPARTLPAPTTVSPQMQRIIQAPINPDW